MTGPHPDAMDTPAGPGGSGAERDSSLHITTVVTARPAHDFGPAYLELCGPGRTVTVKIGSVEAAESLISLCERYVERAKWPG